jgi:molybdate transport system substrate-binding protein
MQFFLSRLFFRPRFIAIVFGALAGIIFSANAKAETVQVAVAANFIAPIKVIADEFEQTGNDEVIIISGGTGKLYSQIKNGAPFDVFLAADSKRPQLLEVEGMLVPGSRFTYAMGQVALWSPDPGMVDERGRVLAEGNFRHIAIANPKLAPYGAAARQILEKHNLWQSLQKKMVHGENIAQAYQFVASGNAELGFVALSQLYSQPVKGSLWVPPQSMYDKIEQQAGLLKPTTVARRFMQFLRSSIARKIIREHGYKL